MLMKKVQPLPSVKYRNSNAGAKIFNPYKCLIINK